MACSKSLRHCLNYNPLKAKLNFTFPLDVCLQTKMSILLYQWECSLTFSAVPATRKFGCGHNGKTSKDYNNNKKQFTIGTTIWKYFIFHEVLFPDPIKLLFLQFSLSAALPCNCPPLFYRYYICNICPHNWHSPQISNNICTKKSHDHPDPIQRTHIHYLRIMSIISQFKVALCLVEIYSKASICWCKYILL